MIYRIPQTLSNGGTKAYTTQVGGLGTLAVTVLNSMNDLLKLLTGDKTVSDAKDSLYSLSTKGSAEFTARFPQGMPTTALDPVAILFSITTLAFMGAPNDGMVGRCSSHVGVVIRDDYKMNHFDQVNQFFGLRDIFGTDPLSLFRQQGNRLKTAGL